jgi:hypothetical protein
MAEVIKDHLLVMLHTSDGARTASKCLDYLNVKERKNVVKSLKPHLEAVSQDQFGSLFIMKVLSVMDDTILVQKHILDHLVTLFPTLAVHPRGYKIILLLLAPEELDMELKPAMVHDKDGNLVSTSFKDPEQRRKELLEYVTDNIIDTCLNHLDSLLSTPHGAKIVQAVLKELPSSPRKDEIYSVLLGLAVLQPSEAVGDEEPFHVLTSNISSRFLCRLLKSEAVKENNFAEQLADRLSGSYKRLIKSRSGEFVLTGLLEAVGKSTRKLMITQLTSLLEKLKEDEDQEEEEEEEEEKDDEENEERKKSKPGEILAKSIAEFKKKK